MFTVLGTIILVIVLIVLVSLIGMQILRGDKKRNAHGRLTALGV